MNFYSILLFAQEAAKTAAENMGAATDAATTATRTQTGGGWMTWIMLIGLFVIMWLFMIRPQRKAQKEQEKFINAIQRGTRVVTAGGIYGTVAEVKDNFLIIEVDKDVKIRVNKNSVQRDPADTTVAAKPEK